MNWARFRERNEHKTQFFAKKFSPPIGICESEKSRKNHGIIQDDKGS